MTDSKKKFMVALQNKDRRLYPPQSGKKRELTHAPDPLNEADTSDTDIKTLHKTHVIVSHQTRLAIDMPWGLTIFEKLFLFMVDRRAYAGNYTINPLHFGHNHLSKLLPSITPLCMI